MGRKWGKQVTAAGPCAAAGTPGLGCRPPALERGQEPGWGHERSASHPGMWAVGGAARAGHAVCQHLTECLSSQPVPLAGASVSLCLPAPSPDSFRRPNWPWWVRGWGFPDGIVEGAGEPRALQVGEGWEGPGKGGLGGDRGRGWGARTGWWRARGWG